MKRLTTLQAAMRDSASWIARNTLVEVSHRFWENRCTHFENPPPPISSPTRYPLMSGYCSELDPSTSMSLPRMATARQV